MSTKKSHPSFSDLQTEFLEILKEAFKENNLDLLETKISAYKRTDLDTKSPLDQAFKHYLLNLLEEEVDVKVLNSYINLSIECCRKHLTSPTVPVVLLSDIFNTLTLDVCEKMFSFVEDNVQTWKEDLFFAACKNHLLRLCNDLLRRLSRTTATVFCGKILLFLAKFFPFSERSGLNIVSEFNLQNITEYGIDATDDNATEVVSGDQKYVIDYPFYCKFWQLQDFFRNPIQCYDKVQWKMFCSHSTTILNTFQGIKLDDVSLANQSFHGTYFAKYLTSQKLLDLQLQDVSFRRSLLLQFLIIFQYFTSSVKFKSDSHELKADQKEWIQTSTEKVYNLLKETPPDGENFAIIVQNILKREELWNSWKNDGCPEIKKFLPQHEPIEIPKRKKPQMLLGDIIKEANMENKFHLGNSELNKLWNICPNNLEACKDRDFLPSLQEYFQDAITQVESGVVVKDDENLMKDSNFGWRALRLLAKRSPYFFSIAVQNHSLPKYLEMMVHKMVHEKPGKNDENGQDAQTEQEIEENILTEQNEDFSKQNEEETEENQPRTEHKQLSEERLKVIIDTITPEWEKLGLKLGYKPDELEWFRNEHPLRFDQAKHMMQVWFEDDEDANLDNLLYILEGLEMNKAAEVVRNELNSVMEIG
ncbi:unnamed protein product [Ceutorhynchus assimilis]|uniref:Death domain-containing protein n=1 Tax=Ceutorhynchus assimilis TaxID=467358 RepID=A0A9N9MN95_9CUCU|nr:unnamed protein product [Ceutorhynchus assimilis]